MVASPSATLLTVPATQHLDAVVVVGHDDRLGELAAELDHLARPPAQMSTARAASAIVNMPWAMTPGRPTEVATRSDQWMGLKSPLAPA